MTISALPELGAPLHQRVEATAALLGRRGYAVSPGRLGEICQGGAVTRTHVLAAVAASPSLRMAEGLVVPPNLLPAAAAIAARACAHRGNADRYEPVALRFVSALVSLGPFVLGVAIAGSLASGGFAASDDVDLNLIVEDGYRHLAYVALNALGALHAIRYRGKPVDAHSRRPLAPRLMTANLILERSQCFPLARRDPDMAFELLASRPVFGSWLWRRVVASNPELTGHFPQLNDWSRSDVISGTRLLPRWLFPAAADRPARALGRAAWGYMQWTRRRRPEALARVAYVRRTMRPYALFDE